MKKLVISLILVSCFGQLNSEFNPNEHTSRLRLVCPNDMQLEQDHHKGDHRDARCIYTNRAGSRKPDLVDIHGKQILFGPGHMEETVYGRVQIRVARTTSGMGVDCSHNHKAVITDSGHLSCETKVRLAVE